MPALRLKLSPMLTLVMTTCPRLQPEPLTPMPALLSKLDLMLTLVMILGGRLQLSTLLPMPALRLKLSPMLTLVMILGGLLSAFNALTDARAPAEAQPDAYARDDAIF